MIEYQYQADALGEDSSCFHCWFNGDLNRLVMSHLLILGDLLEGVSDSVDLDNPSSILVGLFDEVVQPNVFQTHESKAGLQQLFNISVSN